MDVEAELWLDSEEETFGVGGWNLIPGFSPPPVPQSECSILKRREGLKCFGNELLILPTLMFRNFGSFYIGCRGQCLVLFCFCLMSEYSANNKAFGISDLLCSVIPFCPHPGFVLHALVGEGAFG